MFCNVVCYYDDFDVIRSFNFNAWSSEKSLVLKDTKVSKAGGFLVEFSSFYNNDVRLGIHIPLRAYQLRKWRFDNRLPQQNEGVV